jgi:membrane-associated phospholipid phosphatase
MIAPKHPLRERTGQVAHPASGDSPPSLREQLDGLDRAVFRAIAATPTPSLDRAFGVLSRAANHSVLWVAIAAGLASTGTSGRRAAADGLAAIAVTSAVVNLGLKPLGGRRRPNRAGDRVPESRQVEMPDSTSFPSGHSGSAFAFATAIANTWPPVAGPIQTLATLVAYSRVHTGVHYPGDVIVGSTVGSIVGPLASYGMRRWRRSCA